MRVERSLRLENDSVTPNQMHSAVRESPKSSGHRTVVIADTAQGMEFVEAVDWRKTRYVPWNFLRKGSPHVLRCKGWYLC